MYDERQKEIKNLSQLISMAEDKIKMRELELGNKKDFGLIGQFFLRLSLINFTSVSGRLEKADEHFKKLQGQLA